MSRALLVLSSDAIRDKAKRWIDQAPHDTRVVFQGPKRSLDQNAKMWSMLSEVAQQVTYHGIKLTPDDYKLIFMDALRREVRMVPNLDGSGFVSLGRSSSNLSKQEMSDLLEIIYAWGAANGVVFNEPKPEGA